MLGGFSPATGLLPLGCCPHDLGEHPSGLGHPPTADLTGVSIEMEVVAFPAGIQENELICHGDIVPGGCDNETEALVPAGAPAPAPAYRRRNCSDRPARSVSGSQPRPPRGPSQRTSSRSTGRLRNKPRLS